jgi:hypothetical protein
VGIGGELVHLDGRVLLFTFALTILTTLLFGLFPALKTTRTDLSTTIKESASRSGSGLRHNRTRTALVITEMALAVVLLVGAGLLIRTAMAIYSVKPGFETKNILTMRMSLSGKAYEKSAAIDDLVKRAVERIDALPGVALATATCCVPLEGGYGLPFRIMGRPLDKGPFHGGGNWKTVSPGFFEAFQMHMLRGRTFNERDTASSTPVVIITETMAKKFWPKGDPMQDRILIGKGVMPQLETEQPRQIIGVVGDVRDDALNQDPEPGMYLPNAQVPDAIQALNVKLTPLAWVIKTRVDPGFALGGTGDHADLVGARLLDGGSHLAQAVHHLLFDLVDHAGVAEMHLADVDRAQLVAPGLRFAGDLGAHALAHGVARLEHFRQLHIAQAAHRGVAHVGAQRAARIGVLEQVGDRVADPHLVPDADAHGRALFGIDGLAAQVLLIEPQIEHVAVTQKLTTKAAGPSLPGRKYSPGSSRMPTTTFPNSM